MVVFSGHEVREIIFSSFSGRQEYCEWDTFHAVCGKKEVILMTHARYGRLSLGRCISKNYGHLGCSIDVLSLMDSRCSGRQTCRMNILDASFFDVRPCPRYFKTYLEASYNCVQGTVCEILVISCNVAVVYSLAQ